MAVTEAHLKILEESFKKQAWDSIQRGKLRMVRDILGHPTPMTKGEIQKTHYKYRKIFNNSQDLSIHGRVLLLEYVLQQMRSSNRILR